LSFRLHGSLEHLSEAARRLEFVRFCLVKPFLGACLIDCLKLTIFSAFRSLDCPRYSGLLQEKKTQKIRNVTRTKD